MTKKKKGNDTKFIIPFNKKEKNEENAFFSKPKLKTHI